MADAQSRPRRGWREIVPAPLRHGVTVFLVLLILEYFVIPQFVVARHSLSLVDHLNYAWLAVAIICEALAFVTYALLTKTLLPPDSVSTGTVLRIDLAGTAIAHVLPGGSAGSAGLGYRLLTNRGVDGRDAGFAMATQSIGSTAVLNVMLWLALVISIPIAGFKPLYVTVALLGMLALLAFVALIIALTVGEERTARVACRIGGRIRFIGPDRLEQIVRHINTSLRALAGDHRQLRHAALWAAANWLTDAASLWAFVFAFGRTISPIYLFVAYGIANVLAAIPVTPGGLGLVEASSAAILVGFGLPGEVATLAVIGWRLFNFWAPIPIGAATYLSLRVERGAGLRIGGRALSNMAVDATSARRRRNGSPSETATAHDASEKAAPGHA